jgi:hypothetical protein
VRRHAESSNVVLLTVLLEFERVVALMAIKYEQLVGANSVPLRMCVKVLQPLQAQFIRYPAILEDCDYPVVR